MGPIFQRLENEYSEKPVRFVRFNLTNSKTGEETRKLAKSLGINNVFSISETTGVIALLDAKDLSLIGRFDWNQTIESIQEALDKAL